MKPINEFLSDLDELEVKIWSEGDRLRYRAPKDALSTTLLTEMRDRKEEILSFLHQPTLTTNGNSSPVSASQTQEFTTEIEKVEKLIYSDFIINYLDPLRPVVITDAIQNWAALSRWTPEFLKETLGSKEVVVDHKRYCFKDFLDAVILSTDENPVSYLRDTDIPGLFPELLPDIQPFPSYVQYNWLCNPLVYIPKADPVKQRNSFLELLVAGKGTKFPILHFDYWHLHAFIMQIYGVKEFTLYPPNQTEYLYPWFQGSNKSQIPNIHNPDLEQFPLFAKATPFKVIVEPGETIFVPSGWWHTTRMLTSSIAVTVNALSSSNWKSFSQDILPEFTEFTLSKNPGATDNLPQLEIETLNYLSGLGHVLKHFG